MDISVEQLMFSVAQGLNGFERIISRNNFGSRQKSRNKENVMDK